MTKKTFHILTLFPDMFEGAFSESMIKRAQKKELIGIKIYDLRKWGIGKHKQVDDTPYGGGPGMVLKVDVIADAIRDIKFKIKNKKLRTTGYELQTILLTPQGKRYDQAKAASLSKSKVTDIILICGHYEGFDERIRNLVDEEISVGDYILTGGEIPAMILVDSITRLISGVLGKKESYESESFENNLLEYPQYTRPEEYEGSKVPKVLLSGDHSKIEKWRKKESFSKTKKRRKDLLR